MKKTLDKLKEGEEAVIIKINSSGNLKRRLLDMGVVKGTKISVVRCAPLGDPMEINVKGYMLSLRKSEAENIEVDVA